MRGSEFAELKAFAAVVQRTSFVRAADHLGLSASALSQTIRQLETRLGVRLLNRTTRSVATTEAGARLHQRIAPMLEEFDSAVAEAVSSAGRTAGTLRVNTSGMAAKRLIVPKLGRFHRENPDVVLDLVIDDGLSDIVATHCDAGIRIGERLEKDMIAIRLTPDMEMMAVASPEYLAKHGTPKSPSDLHRHACINWRFPGSGHIYRWELEKGRKKLELSVQGPLIVTFSRHCAHSSTACSIKTNRKNHFRAEALSMLSRRVRRRLQYHSMQASGSAASIQEIRSALDRSTIPKE